MNPISISNPDIELLTNDFEGVVVADEIPMSPALSRIVAKFEAIKENVYLQKKTMDETANQIKDFEKLLKRLVKKVAKSEIKATNKPRKLCGFAVPTNVSNDLCEFMGRELGSKIARTEVTKFLMNYIAEKNLQQPENKQVIVPDDGLMRILGDDARDQKITHFNIQKYINKHFDKGTYGLVPSAPN